MSRYRLTPAAAADLEEIYDYVAADNLAVAGRIVDRLTAQFVRLSDMPGIGRSRSELRPDLRSAAEGSYVVFYRIVDSEVQIVRVLHGARDIDAIFRKSNQDNEDEEL